MVIIETTFENIAHNSAFPSLIEKYVLECKIPELPYNGVVLDTYYKLEQLGLLKCLGCYEGDNLVGFALVMHTVLHHVGVRIANTDAIFIDKDYRTGGSGAKLVRAVEKQSKEAGAEGLVCNAPIGSPFEKLLRAMKYRTTTGVNYKKL